MQRRVSLAMALIGDPETRRNMWRLIQRAKARRT